MKASEIIIKRFTGNNTTLGYQEVNMEGLAKVIDQMAEDIKYLKDNLNNPFPYCIEKPIKREWEETK